MRARGVEQGHLFPRDLSKILQQPGYNSVVGRRVGDVRENDADSVRGLNSVSQRLRVDRMGQSVENGGLLVRQSGPMRWKDDGGPIFR